MVSAWATWLILSLILADPSEKRGPKGNHSLADLLRATASARGRPKYQEDLLNKLAIGDATCIAKDDIYLSGKLEITEDTIYEGKRINLGPDLVIRIRHGVALCLDAPEIIVNKNVVIDGNGEPGAVGARGSPKGKVEILANDKDYWDRVRADRSDDRGVQGSPGGKGGPGALVIMRVPPTVEGELTLMTHGGPGGPGGPGGEGVILKNGRNNYCNGCIRQTPGPPGGRGGPGDSGDKIYLEVPSRDNTSPADTSFVSVIHTGP